MRNFEHTKLTTHLHIYFSKNRIDHSSQVPDRSCNCLSVCLLLVVSFGDDEIRTHDFRLAKAALSQLSYVPEPDRLTVFSVSDQLGPGRVELPTSPLSGVRSNQLSYRPHNHFHHDWVNLKTQS